MSGCGQDQEDHLKLNVTLNVNPKWGLKQVVVCS